MYIKYSTLCIAGIPVVVVLSRLPIYIGHVVCVVVQHCGYIIAWTNYCNSCWHCHPDPSWFRMLEPTTAHMYM